MASNRIKLAVGVAACAAVLPAQVATAADGTFTQEAGSPIALSAADAVAVGDFDNDGRQDLAVARTLATNNVNIFGGNGDATFTQEAGSPVSAGPAPEAIVVGDFNEDGNQDLVVANSGPAPGNDSVTVLTGAGNGQFTPLAPVAVGDNPRGLAVGDFDGDQNEDLVVANHGPFAISSNDTVSILQGNGAGVFAPFPVALVGVGDGPEGVAVADFDADGNHDLAVASLRSDDVRVFGGNGDGTFSPESSPTVSDDPVGVASGDFDADGNEDLAVTGDTSGDLTILGGNGSGDFAPESGSPVDVGTRPQAVVVGDFNTDGAEDLAVTNYDGPVAGPDEISVLLGARNGTFAPAAPVVTGNGADHLAIGDFDGDGAEDLAVANFDAGSVTIFGGNGGPAQPQNLLVNGRAEGAGAGRTTTAEPDVPGWVDTGDLTFVRYSSPAFFPSLLQAPRWAGGSSFFVGGPGNATSSATQTVDISASAPSVDAGLATTTLSGYLGGLLAQNDRMKVTATFRGGDLSTLGSISIGPVTSGDRRNQSVMLRRVAQGVVPPGARSIEVRLDAIRVSGSYNNGLADELALTLSAPAPPAPPGPGPTPTPEPEPTPPADTSDTSPPDTTITKGPGGRIRVRRAAIEFSSTEAGSTFECKLDGRDFAPCTSPRRLRRLGPGRHTFQVRATDPSGNVDPTPARKRFRVVPRG